MVAVQVPQVLQSLVLAEMHHSEAQIRIMAVRRFYVLWTYRYQVWQRLEPGAQLWFKVRSP